MGVVPPWKSSSSPSSLPSSSSPDVAAAGQSASYPKSQMGTKTSSEEENSKDSSQRKAEYKGKDVTAIQAGMPTSVTDAIEITNLSTYTLENPTFALKCGVVEYAPHAEIKPDEKCACGFQKYWIGIQGCLGVLRYAIRDTGTCLDIFFSCPYAGFLYDRTVGIQLENVGNVYVGASRRLLEEIDNRQSSITNFDKKKATDVVAKVSNGAMNLEVTATMLDEWKSIIYVQLIDVER
ncbi:uncharacterized protein LOC133360657 [Lethenteron reissneri]|uniref:uncharacterized protein LOC133360657 n=1 Tax=Lethenteron reissneri TaxID=7753 RepID=UPI002AB7EC56|nr:uncharacterized protein LOC133360657 [Lethenteron reissneri]